MKRTLFILIAGLMLSASACEEKENEPSGMKPVALTPKQQQVINASNSFGFNFFSTAYGISGTTKNFMVSPLSVSMALGMTRNGAAGSTLDSLTTTLGFEGMTEPEINESYKYLTETFTHLDPDVKLLIANSIWYKNSFSIEQQFLSTNMTYFNAEVNPLDFTNPESINVINTWVSDKTNELIPKILEQIPDEMVMYLINAIYFKGQWTYQFKKDNTKPETFILSSGSTVSAPAMKQTVTVPLMTTEDFEAIELPYNQGNFTMTIILPALGVAPVEVITQLTHESWSNWKQSYVDTETQLQLPKFKFSYDEEQMKAILSSMGMGIAFDDYNADFTRINANGDLYISEVKHKTFIETDEEGSTAAAVTSVGVAVTSVPAGPHPFIVDRPFIFMISEKATGTILFIGAVHNPLEN